MTPRLSFAEAIEILAKLQSEGRIAVSVQEDGKRGNRHAERQSRTAAESRGVMYEYDGFDYYGDGREVEVPNA